MTTTETSSATDRATAAGGPRTGRRNRVRPDGELVVDPGRGLFWGNRGSLLGAGGQPSRSPTTRAWVCCVLAFKGRHRVQWQPGKLTELYFLDEATALAAGHRPCGECRVVDYRRFQRAWAAARDEGVPKAFEMDARLQQDRRLATGRQRTYRTAVGTLPDGVLVRWGGEIGLLQGGRWLPWSMAGYGAPHTIAGDRQVDVLTPRITVDVIAAGYEPVIHPSALLP